LIRQNQILSQSVFFLMVGAVATLVHLLVFHVLSSQYQIHAVAANVAAFLFAFSISFVGHSLLTFRTKQKRQFVITGFKFMLLQLVGLSFNTVISINIEYEVIRYEIGLILMGLVTPSFTFFLSKFWVFRS